MKMAVGNGPWPRSTTSCLGIARYLDPEPRQRLAGSSSTDNQTPPRDSLTLLS